MGRTESGKRKVGVGEGEKAGREGEGDFNSPSGPSRLALFADIFGSLLAG